MVGPLEPLRKSIDEEKKSIATANSNYNQLLTKMSTYEKGMTDMVNENKSLKAEILDTTNQLKALKELTIQNLNNTRDETSCKSGVFQRFLMTRGNIRTKLLLSSVERLELT